MIGVKSTSTSYNDVYKYDIQSNTWSYVTSIVWTGLGRKRCLAHGKTICIFNMRDENGKMQGDLTTFPHGIKWLVNEVNDLGLKDLS